MAASPIVSTQAGDLSGGASADGVVSYFKGVPYARPPVGDLRWRAPWDPEPWSGVRSAETFGPRAIQKDRPENSISYFGLEKQSEDCLYLNVWTAAPGRGAKRPVMVWFHGGGYTIGSGALPIFDGEALARRGVVVVTINHRLGPLGFLAHPEMTRESPEGGSGNWGLLDEIAALRWVRDNIENFGGDPGCVTIFGQSVGSTSVNCLMASPAARGLFHRAIGESGGSMSPLGQPGGGSMLTLAAAEKVGLRAAELFGARTLAELRALPAEELQLRWPATPNFRPFPTVDGIILPESLFDIFSNGRQNDVPLLTGANSDEGSARPPFPSVEDWKQYLQREYGEDAQRIFEAYGAGADFRKACKRQGCQKAFNWTNWTWARQHARTGASKTFFYHFSHAPPLPPGFEFTEAVDGWLGAFHTAEIPYVFGTLQKRDWPWRDRDHRLSDTMMSYWVNFATTGDPNADGLARWPTLDPDAPTIMRFAEDVTVGEHPDRGLMDMWDDVTSRMRGAA